MKTFKQYISEGLKRTIRQYNAGIKKSRIEQAGKKAFHDIMGSSIQDRLLSDVFGREDPSTTLFNRADAGVMKMMSRAAAKPEGTDITPLVKNIHTALRTGAVNPSQNMGTKMKKIRTSIDLMRAGDRGEYGSLIPEI